MSGRRGIKSMTRTKLAYFDWWHAAWLESARGKQPTQREIAITLGISRQRVQQLCAERAAELTEK